ncbi:MULTISPECIES: DUF1127 domain-containing protein [Pseudomonas aeruginosa group]|uniref:DUF1127 domain-containing protein n=1 Tax=Pseudomonas aeruginosa group TaxID=136841 RepID=UPI00086AE6C1|nr:MULTISPECIES: DUF1127 domain-containing protein [Pseudomonas aeruginosa group]AVR68149.1 hypothetical protein B7D75_14810 [Pseudomonas paraeruginosa]MBG3907417.1 DUF1127 domain-containing protein [Pseudomonas aeruginosa]MBG4203125.1 DUF1127 domain-containing protein [Pseudomonas aeruginosa]MBG4282995.1 DUF1127 domain-containing protein [Pseudomonas aeruginosa]MBG6893936.1 DUF1127 domain-containing protein [Pseudomonas aeruginosa]
MSGYSARTEHRQRLDGHLPFAVMDTLAQALRRGYRLARHRQQTRRALLELEAAELKDIGLSAEQAREEASRPFWQAGSPRGRNA